MNKHTRYPEEQEAIDWVQIVVGVALIVTCILAAVPVRQFASLGWGL